MEIEKDERIYFAGLGLLLLWDFLQVGMTWENDVLLAFSAANVFITVSGIAATAWDIRQVRSTWMLWYVIPLSLLTFAGLQKHGEISNDVLAMAHAAPLPLPLDGKSGDYVDAFYGHYASLIAAPIIWLLAVASELVRKLRAREAP